MDKELMRKVWNMREQGVVSLHEQDLFFYLWHRMNELGENPFYQSTEVLCAVLGINRNALATRRKRLKDLGLIRYKSGLGRYSPPEYRVILIEKESPKLESETESFSAPSKDEVMQYCVSRGSVINPKRFYNYYQSKNWFVGTRKMKDWQAAIRSWELTEFKPKQQRKHRHAEHTNEDRYEQF